MPELKINWIGEEYVEVIKTTNGSHHVAYVVDVNDIIIFSCLASLVMLEIGTSIELVETRYANVLIVRFPIVNNFIKDKVNIYDFLRENFDHAKD